MKKLEEELFSEHDSLFSSEEDSKPPSVDAKGIVNKLGSKSKNNREWDKLIESAEVPKPNSVIKKAKIKYTKFKSFVGEQKKILSNDEEIEKLNEELRVKKAEIQRLTELQKKQYDGGSNFSFHLAFMFASPLVRKVNNNSLTNVMQLDYQSEISDVLKTLKNTPNEITYKIDVATISNFRSVIADAPFALHFTGHGIQNDRQSLGVAYEIFKDKGNILLLEDSNFMAEYLFERDLKKLVELSNANREFTYNYEVVFVSSCHSEFAGRIFLASGARHVICIEKSQKVLDKAALRFSKVFYETLFMKKYSV